MSLCQFIFILRSGYPDDVLQIVYNNCERIYLIACKFLTFKIFVIHYRYVFDETDIKLTHDTCTIFWV